MNGPHDAVVLSLSNSSEAESNSTSRTQKRGFITPCHLANTIELVHPSAHWSPQPKQQIDQFSCFCTAQGRKSLRFTPELPLTIGGLDLHLIWFLGFMRAQNSKATSIGSVVFAQLTAECHYTLQWFAYFSIKLPLPMGDLGSHVIHGALGLPESSTEMATRSLQPFLQSSIVWQTDRPTDRPIDHAIWPVTKACMYVCTTAMRRNNA